MDSYTISPETIINWLINEGYEIENLQLSSNAPVSELEYKKDVLQTLLPCVGAKPDGTMSMVGFELDWMKRNTLKVAPLLAELNSGKLSSTPDLKQHTGSVSVLKAAPDSAIEYFILVPETVQFKAYVNHDNQLIDVVLWSNQEPVPLPF